MKQRLKDWLPTILTIVASLTCVFVVAYHHGDAFQFNSFLSGLAVGVSAVVYSCNLATVRIKEEIAKLDELERRNEEALLLMPVGREYEA